MRYVAKALHEGLMGNAKYCRVCGRMLDSGYDVCPDCGRPV